MDTGLRSRSIERAPSRARAAGPRAPVLTTGPSSALPSHPLQRPQHPSSSPYFRRCAHRGEPSRIPPGCPGLEAISGRLIERNTGFQRPRMAFRGVCLTFSNQQFRVGLNGPVGRLLRGVRSSLFPTVFHWEPGCVSRNDPPRSLFPRRFARRIRAFAAGGRIDPLLPRQGERACDSAPLEHATGLFVARAVEPSVQP